MTTRTDNPKRLSRSLSGKLVLRHIAAWIFLDITLILITVVGAFHYAEQLIAEDYLRIRTAPVDSPLYESIRYRRPILLGDREISYGNPTRSFHISESLRIMLPTETAAGRRSFRADLNRSGHDLLRSLAYTVSMPVVEGDANPGTGRDEEANGGPKEIGDADEAARAGVAGKTADDGMIYMNISLRLGTFFFRALIILYILSGIELISVIRYGIKTGRDLKKAIEPLSELRRAASQFTQATGASAGPFAQKSLRDLARALDAINVSHLDQRIPHHIITEELKPLAAAINQLLNRVDEAYNAQIRFVSDASHELRTPIAVIQGYANLLSRWGSEDKETLHESIEAIKSEADAMKLMVNQLLFLARGDSKNMKLRWERLDLSAIASEVVKEETIIDQTHQFEARLASGVFIEGDAGLIKQLLRILTDNSVKYSDEDGRITVSLESLPLEGKARLTVQDEGVGIPPEILPLIFDRFVRADESRTRNTGGAGLGLSIGKWIVERHGGYMEVTSRSGLGTRISVLLPLVQG